MHSVTNHEIRRDGEFKTVQMRIQTHLNGGGEYSDGGKEQRGL